jgi:hypothetical protein
MEQRLREFQTLAVPQDEKRKILEFGLSLIGNYATQECEHLEILASEPLLHPWIEKQLINGLSGNVESIGVVLDVLFAQGWRGSGATMQCIFNHLFSKLPGREFIRKHMNRFSGLFFHDCDNTYNQYDVPFILLLCRNGCRPGVFFNYERAETALKTCPFEDFLSFHLLLSQFAKGKPPVRGFMERLLKEIRTFDPKEEVSPSWIGTVHACCVKRPIPIEETLGLLAKLRLAYRGESPAEIARAEAWCSLEKWLPASHFSTEPERAAATIGAATHLSHAEFRCIVDAIATFGRPPFTIDDIPFTKVDPVFTKNSNRNKIAAVELFGVRTLKCWWSAVWLFLLAVPRPRDSTLDPRECLWLQLLPLEIVCMIANYLYGGECGFVLNIVRDLRLEAASEQQGPSA